MGKSWILDKSGTTRNRIGLQYSDLSVILDDIYDTPISLIVKIIGDKHFAVQSNNSFFVPVQESKRVLFVEAIWSMLTQENKESDYLQAYLTCDSNPKITNLKKYSLVLDYELEPCFYSEIGAVLDQIIDPSKLYQLGKKHDVLQQVREYGWVGRTFIERQKLPLETNRVRIVLDLMPNNSKQPPLVLKSIYPIKKDVLL